jgi:hypothetical protein
MPPPEEPCHPWTRGDLRGGRRLLPHSGGAQAALVLATDPTFATITRTATAFLPDTVPYQSGEFYRRELPALHAVPRRCGIATMFTARRLCALP